MRDKKKIILGVSVCVVIVVLLVLFIPKKSVFFYNNNAESIEKITMMNGNTGDIIYVSSEDYEYVLSYLDDYTFTPDYFRKTKDGWGYRFTITSSGKKVDMFFTGINVEIDGVKYKCTNSSGTSLDEIWENVK